MIVDTNDLCAWWLNEPSFIRHIEHADRLCVPVPALSEFRFGILKSRFQDRMTTWLDDALGWDKGNTQGLARPSPRTSPNCGR